MDPRPLICGLAMGQRCAEQHPNKRGGAEMEVTTIGIDLANRAVAVRRAASSGGGGVQVGKSGTALCNQLPVELTRFRRRCWGERKKEAPNAKNPSTIRAGVSAPNHRVGAHGAPDCAVGP